MIGKHELIRVTISNMVMFIHRHRYWRDKLDVQIDFPVK